VADGALLRCGFDGLVSAVIVVLCFFNDMDWGRVVKDLEYQGGRPDGSES
jgi:hypothetical protein